MKRSPTSVRSRSFLALSLLAIIMVARVLAHNVEARYLEPMPWKKPHFARVLALGYAELGLDLDRSHAEMKTIAGNSCIVGNMVAFEVEHQYAFDIDEPVDLTLTYAPEFTTAPIVVLWNKNAGTGRGDVIIDPEPGETLRRVTVTLDRARLANFGTQGVDIAVGSTEDEPGSGIPKGKVALCDIEISRSGKTQSPSAFGSVHLEIRDAITEALVPARVGLYDATGRAPLPSDQALLVERFADKVRLLSVDPRAFWPSDNRVAFYVKGSYEGKLPVGTYELIVTRGPEYRLHHSRFEVRAGQTTQVSVAMERYANLPDRGWFSGDDHIHLARDESRDASVWSQVAAEDVHVGNLLQMGNIAGTYFEQPAWGKAGRFEHDSYLIVSGQEDPRTGQLGHTIHHNLQSPIHLSQDTYFLYHRVFEESHRQGGISGYAHLNAGWFNVRRGVALDVPYGDVDFLEVFQAGKLLTDIWYDFLNLGYKLTPSAGSDFPYTDLPGVVRDYVKVDGSYDPDAWYASFRAGHVYVTNGPFLEFTVNGHPMGDEIHVPRGSRLNVVAQAQLNPDVDKLDRLELVALGDVVATESAAGQDRVQLDRQLTADHSLWIAVRAYGSRQEEWNITAAHSAPVYVVVDEQPTWKREAVPQLVERERNVLKEILTAPLVPAEDLEAFETGKLLLEQWPKQLQLLKPRVQHADEMYQQLLERVQKAR
ncbi:MAG TPA: CehA/McbA family metallohydrolase [Terriglobales bacterium]|nr:CehA/McbA family metallohydrolase [Terriglobales bacterium]